MSYIFLRLFYVIWTLGWWAFTLSSVSRAIFGRHKPLRRNGRPLSDVIRAVGFSFIWPLALLSPDGRKLLLGRFTKI